MKRLVSVLLAGVISIPGAWRLRRRPHTNVGPHGDTDPDGAMGS